jgi:hypothetical protein
MFWSLEFKPGPFFWMQTGKFPHKSGKIQQKAALINHTVKKA